MSRVKIVLKRWLDMKKELCQLTLGVLFTIIVNALNARITIEIGEIFDNIGILKDALIKLSIMFIGMTISAFLAEMLFTKGQHGGFHKEIDRYHNKIIESDFNIYTKYSISGIQSLSTCVWKIAALGKITAHFIISLGSIIIYILSIYTVRKELMIPIVVIYILGAICMKFLFAKFSELDEIADRCKRIRQQKSEDIILGFMEVKSFGMQEWHRKDIQKSNEETFEAFRKRRWIDASIGAVMQILDSSATIIAILYVARFIINGSMTPAEGMVIISLVMSIVSPLNTIVSFINSASENLSMIDKYDEFMNYENVVQNNGNINLSSFNDKIELKDISFQYNDSSFNINHVNMTIKAGQKIGICGESGGGKSTLIKLLNHFYDPNGGEILIDGINLKEITDQSLRKRMGSVHQESFIFPGSIKDNIIYGSKGYNEMDLINACKKANIYKFIMSLDDKFETEVGPRGLKLSGGQKQRIALARVILRNPDIILLDEATSALDNESEYLIQKAIDKMGKDKTIISIAHRLTTIEKCDVIYVFGNGGIIEQGTHEELMALNGTYAKMYQKQFDDEEEEV